MIPFLKQKLDRRRHDEHNGSSYDAMEHVNDDMENLSYAYMSHMHKISISSVFTTHPKKINEEKTMLRRRKKTQRKNETHFHS